MKYVVLSPENLNRLFNSLAAEHHRSPLRCFLIGNTEGCKNRFTRAEVTSLIHGVCTFVATNKKNALDHVATVTDFRYGDQSKHLVCNLLARG